MEKNVFATLAAIDCNAHVEKKNGLSYLSWAWAWYYVKSNYPTAFFTVYENEEGRPYFDDGRTCWVKTGVTIEGLTHIEYLPIMDYNNRSIPVEKVTSMDVNKAIQRSLTKAAARHGLGLYIYAGEDLPEMSDGQPVVSDAVKKTAALREEGKKKSTTKKTTSQPEPEPQAYTPMDSATYWKIVEAAALGKKTKSGGDYRAEWIAHTHAGEEEVGKFDHDVENVKAARQLNILNQ